MAEFLMGATAMASAVAALFFLRFWRETGDRLFATFAVSFGLLGVIRLGLALSKEPSEGDTYWYWLRLVAFVLILVAIIDKNRKAQPRPE